MMRRTRSSILRYRRGSAGDGREKEFPASTKRNHQRRSLVCGFTDQASGDCGLRKKGRKEKKKKEP